MKKLSLTENQYKLLQEFFNKKKVSSMKKLADEMMMLSVEYDFNTDFGLAVYTDEEYIYLKVDNNLNLAYRRALASVSLLPLDDINDFVNGKTSSLIICNQEQVIHEGKYIKIDFREILQLIKGDLDDNQ